MQIEFTLDGSAPLTPIEFGLSFHDSLAYAWTDSFQLDVQDSEANIQIASTSLVYDTNDDDVISPGESGHVRVFLENIGTSNALDVWAALESYDVNVTIDDCTGWYNYPCDGSCSCEDSGSTYDIDAGYTYTSAYAMQIEFTLDGSAPLTPIDFGLSFHDSLAYSWTDSFQLGVY
jgi:hypothetical protein